MAFKSRKQKYSPEPFENESVTVENEDVGYPEEYAAPVQRKSDYAFKVRNLTKDYDGNAEEQPSL